MQGQSSDSQARAAERLFVAVVNQAIFVGARRRCERCRALALEQRF